MKKKIIAVALAATMVGSACALTGCSDTKQAYVSLDINPAIELVVDRDGKVISVRGENEDGQVLLYNEVGIKGETIDAAIEKITNLAVEYGYLGENNKVVDTIVTSGNSGFAEKILNKVNTTVVATAEASGLTITTDGEGAYSLLRRLEEFKKQYPNDTTIQNISVSKFKLALSVSETGEISLEAAAKLNDAELIKQLTSATEDLESYATTAYVQAKNQASAIYDKSVELAKATAYFGACTLKANTKPSVAYNAALYNAYLIMAKGLGVTASAMTVAASVANYPLNEAAVTAAATALGLSSVDVLKNSNGEITVNSIEAYADKLFKNSPAGEALEQTKAALSTALAQLESIAKQAVSAVYEKYGTEIDSAITSAQKTIDGIKYAVLAALPESAKADFTTALEDFNKLVTSLKNLVSGGLTVDKVKDCKAEFEKRSEEYYKKSRDDLSNEDAESIDKAVSLVENTLNSYKQTMEQTLSKAENEAKQYLANLKAQLTAKA